VERTVVVGVDGSGPGHEALAFGVRAAAATGSRLELVHIVDLEAEATLGERGAEAVRRTGLDLLQAAAEEALALEPSVPARTRIVSGSPMWELVAASVGAELVVVGTHKTGFIRGRVFGSRSLFLAAAARCPVAVIPLMDAAPRRGVTVGFDASPASFAALRFAVATATADTGEDLTIIRALVPAERHGESDAVREHREQVQQRAATALLLVAESAAKAISPGITVRTRIVRTSAAEALVSASASAKLLVMGSGREREQSHPALGPTGHDVLMNLAGPAIIVHGTDR
jgi:nucleotide-binding universal stress UspA family protein